jgi:dTDP-4-dehydrorhamnose reductase
LKSEKPIRLLVLGASGMLGNAVMKFFNKSKGFEVFGTVRSKNALSLLPTTLQKNVIAGVDVENFDNLTHLFCSVRPTIVINCIGLVKQMLAADDPLAALPINSILPHRLAKLCSLLDARLIHISTDCVFSGESGMYVENDFPDARDLYGRSKLLGEVDYENSITLRTSIIGHELDGAKSLVGWFLAQKNQVKGYKRAVFSGLPTMEVSRVIHDYVIPNNNLHGLYHLSAAPINKYDLLTLVAEIYRKDIEIIPDETLVIDRSLDSTRFRSATGFKPKSWNEMLILMHDFR